MEDRKIPAKRPWARFFVITPRETDELKKSQLDARNQLFPKQKRFNEVSTTKNITVK